MKAGPGTLRSQDPCRSNLDLDQQRTVRVAPCAIPCAERSIRGTLSDRQGRQSQLAEGLIP